ncbi:MAG TPA: MFS transporter [Thermomicrobiales bacterium]
MAGGSVLATLRHRDFALLWVAGLISVAGDYALMVALPLHAYELTGSAIATGGVFAATLLPRVLLGSVIGVFVDRWDRKRTMVGADLLRALALLPMLAVTSADLIWILYAVRALTGTLALFFDPAENALLPRLVGEERLVAANALNALNNNLGRLGGPAAGGALYAWGELSAVAIADAATFVVSAILILAIRANTRPEPSSKRPAAASKFEQMVSEWWAGLRLIRRERAIATVFIAFGIGMVGEGTFSVGFAPLVVDVLDGGASGAGVLVSAQAIGGLAAGALVARAGARMAQHLLFAGGMVGLGLTDLAVANAATVVTPGRPAIALAAGVMVLAGFPVVAMHAAGMGLLQAQAEDAYRGRVFGAFDAVAAVTMLIGLGVGGVAIDALGVVPVVSVGAAMWFIGGAIAATRLPRHLQTASAVDSRSLVS